jgi:DNA-binding response OmpR family regulator
MSENEKLKLLENLVVLLADDDEIILSSTSLIFNRFFKKVFLAKDGKEAIEIFNKNSIDICFLDIKMPFFNGIEVAKYIRAKNTKMPIVILTNNKEPDELIEIINLNITLFLLKPLNYDKLQKAFLVCVDKLLEYNILRQKLGECLEYDFISKKILKNGQEINLSKKEIDLLELLLKNRGKLVTESCINEAIWNNEMTTQALRNTVLRLRQKVGVKIVSNVQSLGYIIP